MEYDNRQVYLPEADTMLLLVAARKEARPGDCVLEVGTGSGLIAREIGRVARVVATDISPHAVICAHRLGIDVVRADLVSGIRGKFDLVVFNPPYLPTQPEERIDDWLEYALDGGSDGRSVIERFARDVGSVLAPAGRILLLISSLTGPGEVREIFAGRGYSVRTVLRQDAEGEMLAVLRITRKDRNAQRPPFSGASGAR